MPARPSQYRPARTASRQPKPFNTMYGRHWKEKIRAPFLQANPLCIECQRAGKIEEATDVDHIEPHRGDLAKFHDWSNLQALCHSCHSRKTGRGE